MSFHTIYVKKNSVIDLLNLRSKTVTEEIHDIKKV